MALSGFEVRDYAINLLRKESARDRQVKVGASNISNPCARCLARDLAGVPSDPVRAWLGGEIGNGIHERFEGAQSDAEFVRNIIKSEALIESKIVLGNLGSYGEVKSKPDTVLVDHKHLIDWKSSMRDKSKARLQALGLPISGRACGAETVAKALTKMNGYITQAQLYAWGLNNSGVEIEAVSLVFVNRDGTGWFDVPGYDDYDNPNKTHDVWEVTVPYSEEHALAAWGRALTLWEGIEAGKSWEDLKGHEHCFQCEMDGAI